MHQCDDADAECRYDKSQRHQSWLEDFWLGVSDADAAAGVDPDDDVVACNVCLYQEKSLGRISEGQAEDL